MPFLDRLQTWAGSDPHTTAIEVGHDRLSYAELRDLAAAALPTTPALTVLSRPNGLGLVVAFAAGVAGTRRCAVLDPAWPAAHLGAVERRLRAVLPAADEGTAAATPDSALKDGPGESDFLYGLTSGTSALPKAFTRDRRSWRLAFAASGDYFALGRHDRTLAPGPLSASLNLYALAESLHAGGAFVTLPRFDVGAAITTIAERGITRLVAVPTVLRLLSERGLAAGVDGGALTSIVSAGARLDAATLDAARRFAPHATVFEYYGAAELGFVSASTLKPGEARSGQASVVGRAFPGVEITIRDDAGGDAPVGAAGTIFVRSPFVSGGYLWGDDGAAFRRDGDWSTVGDRGFLDAAGVLHYLDRGGDLIVTAGHNVYPHEVETALCSVAGVREVVVTGVPDARRGARVVAAVIADQATDAARLRAASAALLAGPKHPRGYYRLTSLPVTATGKVSRSLLAQWIQNGDERVSLLE